MVDRSRFFPLSFFLICAGITGVVFFACEIFDLKSKIKKLETDKALLEEKVRALGENK